MTFDLLSIDSSRRPFVVLAVLGLIALAGCGGDDVRAGATTSTTLQVDSTVAPSTAAPTTAAPTTEAPSTVPPTTAAPTTAAPTTAAPTTAVPTTVAPTTVAPTTIAPTTVAPNGAECLIGEWLVTDEALDEYFETVTDLEPSRSISNDGVMRFSFDGSVYVRELDTTVTMGIGGSVYVAVHAMALRQPYSVVDGELRSAGEPTFVGESTVTKDGQPFIDDPGSDLFVGIIPNGVVDALEFSCDGPTLTVGAGPDPDATADLPLTPA